MSEKSNFNQVAQEVFPTLEQYVPVVDRVHGAHHPEFHEVRRLFNVINKKTKEAGAAKPELALEFTQLRETTKDYVIPEDVCETFEAVYDMLKQANEAYQVK